MDCRGFALLAAVVGASALGGLVSCSGGDPASLTFRERGHQDSDLTGSGDKGSSSGGDASGGGAGGAVVDGGSVHAFSTAAAYAATSPTDNSQNASHSNGGNPAGQNCMDCHVTGGAGPAWGIAGTVYTTTQGTVPVAQAEVRLVDAKGQELARTYSDDKGNFWSTSILGGIPKGAMIGVRTATSTKLMTAALGAQDGGCQKAGCHVQGGQGRISLQ